ncbi:MAG TPA: hypothetical protein VK595_05210, partial [Vicinamibacterales bacterium]|nr:hypothetical protein [Vicinamibacterales bacterium]
ETLGINVGTAAIPLVRDLTDDVTGLANTISRIVQRDDLDLGEKLNKILDAAEVEAKPWIDKLERAIDEADLPGKLADGVSAAAPEVASAVAKLAPVAASAFVRTWLGADVWGRLAIGGFLLAKMGGPSAFRVLGRRAGAEMAPGIAAGVGSGAAAGAGIGAAIGTATAQQTITWVKGPGGALIAQTGTVMGTTAGKAVAPAVTTAVANSGLKGRMTGMFRAWGPGIGAALALTLGPELVKMIDDAALPTAENGLPKTSSAIGRGLREAIGRSTQGDLGDWLNFSVNPAGRLADGVLTAVGIGPDTEAKLRTFGDTAGAAFDRLNKAGDGAGMKKLADQARTLAREFPQAGDQLNKFADDVDKVSAPARRVAQAIARMESGSSTSIKQLRGSVRDGMAVIKRDLGNKSAEGKEALSANFQAAIKNVKTSMKAGTISTKEGTAEIARLMRKALAVYGIKGKDAARYMASPTGDITGKHMDNPGQAGPKPGAQRGGLFQFGRPGDRGPDNISARIGGQDVMVGSGEVAAVFNRHQLPVVNARLSDMGGLPGLFKQVKTPHSFAGGGMVPKGGFPDAMGALPGMDALAWALSKKFGLHVSSGARPGAITTSGNPSDHGWGGAIDVTNGITTPQMDAANSWLDTVMGSAIKQKLYRTMVGGDHFNHIHVALQQAFANSAAAVMRLIRSGGDAMFGPAPKLARVLIDGPDSALKGVVQGAVDVTRGAAQSRLDSIAQSMMSSTGSITGPGGTDALTATGNGADLMRQISGQRGWNFADWWTVDGRETGHGADLVNESSGAINRAQFLGSNIGAYGPGSVRGASMAQQIASMAEYIADRYGNPTAARKFHDSHNWYAPGGLVGTARQLGAGVPNGIKGKLPLSDRLKKTLKKVRGGDRGDRQTAMRGLLDRIGDIGLPKNLTRNLAKFAGDADIFGDYANRASSLTDTGAIT